MLKGSRSGILKRVQPVSIHGQLSLDIFFTDPEDPDAHLPLPRVMELKHRLRFGWS